MPTKDETKKVVKRQEDPRNNQPQEQDTSLSSDEIAEIMLSTIDTLVEDRISKAKYDKTVTGNISRIINAQEHQYEIKLSTGGTITAHDNNEWGLYPIGASVLVNWPLNDTNQNKTIIKKISNDLNSFTATFVDTRDTEQDSEHHPLAYIIESYPSGAELQYVLQFVSEEWAQAHPDVENPEDYCIGLVLPDGSRIDLVDFDF